MARRITYSPLDQYIIMLLASLFPFFFLTKSNLILLPNLFHLIKLVMLVKDGNLGVANLIDLMIHKEHMKWSNDSVFLVVLPLVENYGNKFCIRKSFIFINRIQLP